MALFFEKYYNGDKNLNVKSFENIKFFMDLKNSDGKLDISKTVEPEVKDMYIKKANEIAAQDVPRLKASEYIMFVRNGNRSVYESYCFKRRDNMLTLLIAAVLIESDYADENETEKSARRNSSPILNALADYVWAICEESTWVIPAHNQSEPNHRCALTAQWRDVRYIDLFAAAAGADMAAVWYMGDMLDSISPLIRRRIKDELERRIFVPFMKYDMYWMGFDGRPVNNWNPWIASNILTAFAFACEDDNARHDAVIRSMKIIDNFTRFYHDDGGCDEGCGYWNVAGASYFDALEIIYDMTGGEIDIFREPFIKNMGEYVVDFYSGGRWCVNFADCAPTAVPPAFICARFGRRTGSEKLRRLGTANVKNKNLLDAFSSTVYRGIKNFYEYDILNKSGEPLICDTNKFYPGICVMLQRQCPEFGKGLFLAAKGGNNSESHNHNDVGSFCVYKDGVPVIIDAGVDDYTAKTFSSQRYTIWTMRSLYHNLPNFGDIEQKAGGEYKASEVDYDSERRSLSLNLTGAYPENDILKSYIRKSEMNDDKISITDKIELNSRSEITFNLIFADKPEISQGEINVSGTKIEFDKSLESLIEEIPLPAGRLKNGWQRDMLWRVRLIDKSAPGGEYKLIIS